MSNEYRKRDVARAFGVTLRAARVEQRISQAGLSEISTSLGPILVWVALSTLPMLLRLADALAVEPAG